MKRLLQKPARTFGMFTLLVILSLSMLASCGDQGQAPNEPIASQEQEVVVLARTNPQIQAAMAVQNRHTKDLMAMPGVVGTATSLTENGRPAILIMTTTMKSAAMLPGSLEAVPVRTLVTGEIRALKGKPGGGGGFDPKLKHRPAPNGVSLGHPDITAGTLGCLVQKGGTTYILSNNHVMANENLASINDPIYQPGPFDGGGPADQIAQLNDFVNIVFSTGANNLVDAAIATVSTGDVTGGAVTYGNPRSATIAAAVNMRVMKYGRTTEQTKGRVQGINATVNVGYDSGTARFVNQIIIGGGGFSSGGDSGSLIVVEKGGNARRPVGLLFAGGGGTTIANPIDDVLSAFGVTVVGD